MPPDIVTTLRLSSATHYLVGVAAASRRLSSHAWAVRAIEDALVRQGKSDVILASALKAKSTPPRTQQQQQAAAE